MENYVITYNDIDNRNPLGCGYENIVGKTPRDAINLRFGSKFRRVTGDAARFARIIIVKGAYCPDTNIIRSKGRHVLLCYSDE